MGLEVLVAAAVVNTAGSIYTSNKAAKEQKKANQFQRQQAEMEAARARRDEIRKARIARGAAGVTAEGQGVANSSGAAGGQGSIISQGNSNLSFIDRSAKISDQTSAALGKAITYGNYAQMFGGIANMSLTLASFKAGGGSKVKADQSVGVDTGLHGGGTRN